MTTPYRMATVTPPDGTSPPWWQRAWFRIDRDDAAQRWQWAPRAKRRAVVAAVRRRFHGGCDAAL